MWRCIFFEKVILTESYNRLLLTTSTSFDKGLPSSVSCLNSGGVALSTWSLMTFEVLFRVKCFSIN